MAEIRQPIKRTSIDKKQKIIKAGLKVFSEKGYYNTTTVEIAKIAGVSTEIIYNYFKDKKDIFLHSLKLCFETAFTPMLNTLKQFKPPFNFDIRQQATFFFYRQPYHTIIPHVLFHKAIVGKILSCLQPPHQQRPTHDFCRGVVVFYLP